MTTTATDTRKNVVDYDTTTVVVTEDVDDASAWGGRKGGTRLKVLEKQGSRPRH